VHGESGLQAAQRITESLFSGDATALAAEDFRQLRLDGLPSSALDPAALPDTLTQLLSECGVAASGKQVKDALQRRAVLVNGRPLGLEDNAGPAAVFARERALCERFFLLRLGKKRYHLFEIT
jgi:tyrosyl-tRNA synthetase